VIRSQSTMQTKLSNAEATIDRRANCLARVSEAAHALAATHVQEQFRGAKSRSCLGATSRIDRLQPVPERDRWLAFRWYGLRAIGMMVVSAEPISASNRACDGHHKTSDFGAASEPVHSGGEGCESV
jgi:hypothetical protein